jgi:hypothetical protein
LIGMRGNRISKLPLMECVEKTREIARSIAEHNYERAMEMRSSSFRDAWRTFTTFIRALPHPLKEGQRRLRLAVMNAGAPSPGMNTAARAVVRMGLDKGHIMLGVMNGFQGLIEGQIRELEWMSVNGWASMGGSELGTNRTSPKGKDLYQIARTIEKNNIEGLLIVGGWTGYESAFHLHIERDNYPAFSITAKAARRAATIAAYVPELSHEAAEVAQSLCEALEALPRDGLRPAHGSYKPSQLLFRSGSVFLVDFDQFCLADGALDVGYFLAYLRPPGLWYHRAGTRAWFAHAAATFLAAYDRRLAERGVDEATRTGIQRRCHVYEAALLLKIAARRPNRLHSPRPGEVAALLDEVRTCLGAAG